MRAARFHAFGGPEVIRVEEVEAPTLRGDEVAIEVRVAGLNFADTERRRGLYLADAPLPATLGFEGMGVVAGAGEAANADLVGKRVAFLSPGACAEVAVAPASRCILLPDALDDVTGAAFPVQALTAFHLVETMARVQAQETVLVAAAAGGVGGLVTQLAKRAGARVLGLVSSEKKADVARRFGADDVVVREGDWAARVVWATAGRGVEVFFDSVGKDVADAGLRVLAPFGRWVHFGDASGAPPPLAPGALLEKSLTVSGYWLRTPHPPGVWERGVEQVLELLTRGELRLQVEVLEGLEALATAHRRLEAGETTGKLVVRVAAPW